MTDMMFFLFLLSPLFSTLGFTFTARNSPIVLFPFPSCRFDQIIPPSLVFLILSHFEFFLSHPIAF